ncbi:hypothetical protein CAPTEDRAFT_155510 [Capitella teleta]|uniref:Insulin-degrading enzyme n=1 Tax=Capitella teleta TaxID=283909 RepID=R7USZ9_CAPTE|nr:hypothetical protein CAPTEDRAFT_155510 [Capitella teleta]|eukprot:ELU09335.1 hypothetical protein CAPTEDRAFT_155510 [Capitella teleta]
MAEAHVRKSYNSITKSPEDKRQYRGLELTNGLKVLLISDPDTDSSSAALDVHIGHMSDPDDLPGLAHFCEHMLFLGTEKYPTENEYNKFLNEHGGSSNAYTSSEHTNYYFDVAPDHLSGALERFAQFFICPLFTASATEREVNAVHSENDKNLQNDTWRLHQLERSTADLSHAFSKFGTGNRTTLLDDPKSRGQDPREELLKFHRQFYSSNIMALSVLGKETLDELTDLVLPLFTQTENRNVTIPEWHQHPFGPDQVKMKANVVPVKDIRSLNVTWPIPDLTPHYKANPGHYISHLIGHEGTGSLLSELKNRGWVNTLVGGPKAGAKGFMFFIVNVDLSEEGIDHVDDIIVLIFQYLNLLRNTGPLKWVFDECRDLGAMSFRFKDKEKPRSFTCSSASLLHEYPLEEVLCGGYLMEEFSPKLITDLLADLTPETIRVAVVGQKFKGQTNLTERWYGTEYSMEKIPEVTLQQWRNAGLNGNLTLPEKNEFIPTNFELVAREAPCIMPHIISDSPMTRLWYLQDQTFLMPKNCLSLQLTSPLAYQDPLSTNLIYLFVALFKDALNEYAYYAEIAGLHYSLSSTIYGLSLSMGGYSHKQAILLQRILDKMTTFQVDQQRFNILKEKYVRGLKNFKAEQPHQHAIYYTTLLLSEQLWTKEELLEATNEMTCKKLQSFIPMVLEKISLEFFIHGNVTRQGALELARIVEDTLCSRTEARPLLPSQLRRFREVQLPDGCSYAYHAHNEVHKNSALEVYYQCNVQESRANILLELFCQLIAEPCFDILRTQEQLGYIVFIGVRRSNGVQGMRVIVQSDRRPEYVESRIEAFLLKMQSHVADMSPAVFENHVKALCIKRLEKPKKIMSQHKNYWSEIVCQQYNFDRDEVEVAELKKLTKDDVYNFYQEMIAHDAPKRHKLSVHVVSKVESEDCFDQSDVVPPAKAEVIEDVNVFKRELGLFPLPKPFMTIREALSKL